MYPFIVKSLNKTRMHSSRMRTVRSSDRISGGGWCLFPQGGICSGVSAPGVCSHGGGVSAPGGHVCSRGGGVSAPRGGVCSQGVCSGGCLLQGVSDLERGCLLPGGVCSRGGLIWRGGLLTGGCLLWGGGIQACTEADTPTPLWTDRRL